MEPGTSPGGARGLPGDWVVGVCSEVAGAAPLLAGFGTDTGPGARSLGSCRMLSAVAAAGTRSGGGLGVWARTKERRRARAPQRGGTPASAAGGLAARAPPRGGPDCIAARPALALPRSPRDAGGREDPGGTRSGDPEGRTALRLLRLPARSPASCPCDTPSPARQALLFRSTMPRTPPHPTPPPPSQPKQPARPRSPPGAGGRPVPAVRPAPGAWGAGSQRNRRARQRSTGHQRGKGRPYAHVRRPHSPPALAARAACPVNGDSLAALASTAAAADTVRRRYPPPRPRYPYPACTARRAWMGGGGMGG